ncbi:carboxypeptidase-like regulatory domain-containing protein [Zunongwangia pacifica]|uniref:Carboxypeptidase-like regulatory domain-containing protein n=1 Tax=Zunongwangia pacifica TaxID=2911062 RepID=A0A9X1ZMK6_9FLAO|nr:carboxypeptidase-like regulatory domain-containing protein [Zunongwangia pacifica]MCL6217527.1 carboxypeptidase-like regulatory domain-containing protein [Zunongwangia pacifica]
MKRVDKSYSKFLMAFFLMLGIGFFNKMSAQEFKTISGNVTSVEGRALKGVNIFVPNTSFGSTTDAKGNFEMQIPADSKVVISYIGFATKTIDASKTTDFRLTLQKEVNQQENVVVVNYDKEVEKRKSRILKIEK